MTRRVFDLRTIGPCLEVHVSPSSAHIEWLREKEYSIPEPMKVQMMIDTGASVSALHLGIAEKLGLQQRSFADISTPSHRNFRCAQYDIGLFLPGHDFRIENVSVIESDFEAQGVGGLLGRDVLKRGLLIFNGPDDSFVLSF